MVIERVSARARVCMCVCAGARVCVGVCGHFHIYIVKSLSGT